MRYHVSVILLGKKELVSLLLLASGCYVAVIVICLLLTVPWVGLKCLIEAFPGHTHLQCGPKGF